MGLGTIRFAREKSQGDFTVDAEIGSFSEVHQAIEKVFLKAELAEETYSGRTVGKFDTR